MNIKDILKIVIAGIISLVIVLLTGNNTTSNSPVLTYRVYLDGKEIGLINSKDELEDYIDKQQDKLKEKFKVDKVYIPNEINIVKDITYSSNVDSVTSVYNKINNISPFTIKGYQITIDRTNSTVYENDDNSNSDEEKVIKIYVLNKEIFTKAIETVILSFVDEGEYNAYMEGNQVSIEKTGHVVENIYIEDEITILETNIATNSNIYTDVESLTKYLIFGNNVSSNTYVVKTGDTIAKIANNNQMSVNELLIANSNIHSENALLFVGQKIHTGIVDPIINTVVEQHEVVDQTVKFITEYRYDSSKLSGYSLTIQEGIDGVTRISQNVKTINGEIANASIVSSEEMVPVVNRIIIRGGNAVKRGDGQWLWPTNYPYIISSKYGWRWGKMHTGVDICGTGRGSPIYAARAGTVVKISYHYSMGYYVTIRHDNGYYTQYEHMQNTRGGDSAGGVGSATRYIEVGEYVEAKTVIGEMGSSGSSTGVHLHFEIWDGAPYASNSYNPLLFY